MERGIIRRRWQFTIPPGIRRQLNLYQGQLLNCDVQEDGGQVFIRLYAGSFATREDQAAFQELFGKKGKGKRGSKCRGNFRKSAEKRSKKLESWKNPQRTEVSELKSLVSPD